MVKLIQIIGRYMSNSKEKSVSVLKFLVQKIPGLKEKYEAMKKSGQEPTLELLIEEMKSLHPSLKEALSKPYSLSAEDLLDFPEELRPILCTVDLSGSSDQIKAQCDLIGIKDISIPQPIKSLSLLGEVLGKRIMFLGTTSFQHPKLISKNYLTHTSLNNHNKIGLHNARGLFRFNQFLQQLLDVNYAVSYNSNVMINHIKDVNFPHTQLQTLVPKLRKHPLSDHIVCATFDVNITTKELIDGYSGTLTVAMVSEPYFIVLDGDKRTLVPAVNDEGNKPKPLRFYIHSMTNVISNFIKISENKVDDFIDAIGFFGLRTGPTVSATITDDMVVQALVRMFGRDLVDQAMLDCQKMVLNAMHEYINTYNPENAVLVPNAMTDKLS